MNAFVYTALAPNRERNLFGAEWIDINPPAASIEADVAVHERENRVVAAEADVFPRLKLRAALPHDNVSGDYHFAAKFFHAKPLTDAVAAVLNAALSFFVSHCLGFFGF